MNKIKKTYRYSACSNNPHDHQSITHTERDLHRTNFSNKKTQNKLSQKKNTSSKTKFLKN